MLNLQYMIYMYTVKTEILGTYEITKEMVLDEISATDLSQEAIDEYLEIIFAINNEQRVYCLITNKGDFLLYIDKNCVNDQ